MMPKEHRILDGFQSENIRNTYKFIKNVPNKFRLNSDDDKEHQNIVGIYSKETRREPEISRRIPQILGTYW